MNYQFNNGGSTRKHWSGDCVTRALAIGLSLPYDSVYRELKRIDPSASNTKGTNLATVHTYLASLGWRYVSATSPLWLQRDEDIPQVGRLIVNTNRHLTAIIDGTIHDTYDCSLLCLSVKGWWVK